MSFFIGKQRIIIPIVFHGIVSGNKEKSFTDIGESSFKRIVEFCKNQTITDVSASERSSGASFLLTFDDGLSSDYNIAMPLLKRVGERGVFFIISEFIGKPGYMTKSEIRGLVEEGMEIGSHTHSHANLLEIGEYAARNELSYSKKLIEDIIGQSVNKFSFPFGKLNLRLVRIANEEGYRQTFGSFHGVISCNKSVYPRNSINAAMNWNDIRATLLASKKTRVRWKIEDKLKFVLKKCFGDEKYRTIRDKILGT